MPDNSSFCLNGFVACSWKTDWCMLALVPLLVTVCKHAMMQCGNLYVFEVAMFVLAEHQVPWQCCSLGQWA